MVITRCLSISSMPISPSPALLRRHVAVIGAGAAGLVAARELHREGHSVAVFERGSGVGGTWIYSPETESDPLGLDPNRSVVHTSLYDSLRTNLPRECMGFFDYPFVAVDDGREGDSRRFPSHQEVLRYLEDFARDFEVLEVVRFRTEVVRVEMEEEGKWAVSWRRVAAGEDGGGEITGGGEDQVEEIYDGVVVCNGHYTEPRLAAIPGINPLLQLFKDHFFWKIFELYMELDFKAPELQKH